MCDGGLAAASMEDYGQPFGGNLCPDPEERVRIAIAEAETYQQRKLSDKEKTDIRKNILNP